MGIAQNTATNPLDALPAKRRLFVESYVKLMNATQAAEAAGYKAPMQEGCRLLSYADVMAAVVWLFERTIRERYPNRIMSKEEMIERLSAMGSTDLSDFLGEGKEIDPTTKQERRVIYTTIDLAKAKERGKMFLIKSIKPTEWGIEVTFHDVQNAMKLLGRLMGYEAPRRTELSGKDGAPIQVESPYDLSALDDVELAEFQRLLAKARKKPQP